MMLTKIISGGQTGVDIAALRAAKQLGIPTGGFIPKGYRTLDGDKPCYKDGFGMEETKSRDWPERTRQNIIAADFTLILAFHQSRGTDLTRRTAEELGKPFEYVEMRLEEDGRNVDDAYEPFALADWLDTYNIVNVAGNRDKHLERPVQSWFRDVLFGRQEHAEMMQEYLPHFEHLFGTVKAFGDECELFAVSQSAYPAREYAFKIFQQSGLAYDMDESYLSDARCVIDGFARVYGNDPADLENWRINPQRRNDSFPIWIFDPTNWYGIPNG